MTLPRNTKLILEGELTVEAQLWGAVHHSIAEVGVLSRSRPIKRAENGPGLIRGASVGQPMTPALQLALAKRSVSDRMARRRE